MFAGDIIRLFGWELLDSAGNSASLVTCVVDPFVGTGTSIALANHLGIPAIGIDISARRCKQASAADGAALLGLKEYPDRHQRAQPHSQPEEVPLTPPLRRRPIEKKKK